MCNIYLCNTSLALGDTGLGLVFVCRVKTNLDCVRELIGSSNNVSRSVCDTSTLEPIGTHAVQELCG
jgi:hypothetical protein